MKNVFCGLFLMVLVGCTGVRPYGGEGSIRIHLDGDESAAEVTLERLLGGLLVTYDVLDEELVAKPDEKIWMSDCVEFYADLRPYRERVLLNTYARGVFQVIAVPPVDGAPVRAELISRGFPVPEGFSATGRLTESGYMIQLFLPEKSFAEIHGSLKGTIYLDVALKDVDANAKQDLFWKGNGDNWQHPSNFSPVTLPVP